MTVLYLDHVWRVYPSGAVPVIALADVTLAVRPGEFVAIMGPSGSGKRTLLQLMGLLARPSRGRVLLYDQDLSALSEAARARLRLEQIGFIFQRFHLLHDLTAIENVALPMEALGVPTASRYARAAALLASVGLADRLGFIPAQLSGGQRQRVAIARALANEPWLLLADEPTGALHSEDKAQILALFRRVHAQGRTILVVTHDPEVAAVASRRLEIRDGRLREVA